MDLHDTYDKPDVINSNKIENDIFDNVNDGEKSCENNDDLTDTVLGMVKQIPFKKALLLFLIFIIAMSDIFEQFILSNFKNTINMGIISSKGILIQSIFIILAYIIMDILVSNKFL